jgi:acylaminoacyl-peptidase
VDQIRKPLLIAHGVNDVRCKLQESDQIVAAMRERGLAVTYVVYPEEGHGFLRPESRTSFNAITEAFFAKHLGGRCEPFGNDLAGSSLQVREGAGAIAGLQESIRENPN